MVKYTELPGDARGSQLNYERALVRQAEALHEWERLASRDYEDDQIYVGLSIRIPHNEGEDYLLTLRCFRAGEKFVAFHAAPTMVEALVGMVNRVRNKSMRWRDDQFKD